MALLTVGSLPQIKYSSISDKSPRHLAFEKRKIPSKTAYHVLPIYEKKKILSKTFLSCPTHFQKWQFLYRKVQDIYQKFPGHSKTYHSKSLIVNKNFQDIYIFLKVLSKTLLSCPTLISEIEEYTMYTRKQVRIWGKQVRDVKLKYS